MRTHTSFEVSKRLKEFMGESAPEPMGGMYVALRAELINKKMTDFAEYCKKWYFVTAGVTGCPAYQLHDLLSRPFCEAFVKVGAKKFGFGEDEITD